MAGRGLSLGIALLGFLALIGQVKASQARRTIACLGSSSSPCSQANLTCESPFVVVLLSAQQGFKASSCPPPGLECGQGDCCQREPGDCLKPLSLTSLPAVAQRCWGKPDCQPGNPPADTSGCNLTTRGTASYVLYQYACVNSSETLNFLESATSEERERGRETAVMRYSDNQTREEGSWSCHVESRDCSPRPVSVFLYVNSSQQQQTSCSTLGINGNSMSCDLTAWFGDVTLPATLGVTLNFTHNISSAWAAVQAEDGSQVRVWCGRDLQPSQQCSGTTPSATSSAATAGATEGQNQGAGLVAAVAVGWVIAVLALIALAVLLVLLLLRRRGSIPEFLGRFRKETPAMPPPDPAALEAPPQSTNAPQVTSPNSAYPGLQEEDTKPSENAYMDMEGSDKDSGKGGKSIQSSHPAPVASEEEYSPLEVQGTEGEMYSPLEVEGNENEYQGMQEEIYENA